MSFLPPLRLRTIVLFVMWVLPVIVYGVLGVVALYQSGWLFHIAWVLPLLWLSAWMLSRFWPAPKLADAAVLQPLQSPTFWTPQDAAAIEVVETFRRQVADIDRLSLADPKRFLGDAEAIATLLARHYHEGAGEHALNPLTLVEVLAAIHLAVEDLEQWTIDNVPGSTLATIGNLQRFPQFAEAVDTGQKASFVLAAIANPIKLLAYPIWRKSGRVAIELQNELVRALYQRYLRQIGYYLIEMYSGRLRGGSSRYRERFGHMAAAVHTVGGDLTRLSELAAVSTTVALIGQVKAGKSSLINALMQEHVAATSVLPQTRRVERFQFELPTLLQSPGRDSGPAPSITLLDTPGYSEVDVTKDQREEIRHATEAADIVLLVMSANVSARESDVQVVRDIVTHYRERRHLKPPSIIAVLTHVDRLRPVREWSPPYDWRAPSSEKERSMRAAVEYLQELFGESITDYACVYTGDTHPVGTSVVEEVVPILVRHLDRGHSTALLKAFYKQLSENRRSQLTRQVSGLIKTAARRMLE